MKRLARLLLAHVWRSLVQWLGWRDFLVTLALNKTVVPLLGLAVWSAALPDRPGITRYYVILLAVQLLTVSYENHTFSHGIYAGALSEALLRPHPVVLGVLGENVAMRIGHFLVGFPLLVVLVAAMGIAFDPAFLLAALPAILLAAALRFLFTWVLALSAFWTEQADGMVSFGETLTFLLGGAAAPISLFPENVRPLAAALPFQAMLGFPAEVAAGNLGSAQILERSADQVAWVGVFAVLALVVWRAGVRRYTAVGG